jgi:hypothetical protein
MEMYFGAGYISVSRRADDVIGCAVALLSSDWRA